MDTPEKPKPAEGTGHIASHVKPAVDVKPRQAYVSPSAKSVPTSVDSPGSTAPVAAPAHSSPREIREATDRLGNLQARADSALSGVEQIRREQQAQGLDIRSDILSSMNRLHYQLNQSRRALEGNDLATANEYMNRADLETARLEKFLGH